VEVFEAAAQIGGGLRTSGLTLPGFRQDIFSAIHPLAVCSPCFERFPLAAHGLEWVHPEAPLAHPLADGGAVMLERSIDGTARTLAEDGDAWRDLFEPLVATWDRLRHDVLGPIGRPRHPLLLARFGASAIRSARGLAERRFTGPRARALFGGLAAHSGMPLEAAASAAVAVVLGVAGHSGGWPFPRGGAQSLAEALAGCLRSLGGTIHTSSPVTALPEAPEVLCDVTPRQFASLAADRLPATFRRQLERYRYGAGVFKMDWALSGPIPWRARDCGRAATVHLGGTLEEIAAWEGGYRGRPFVILAQHTLFDATRAPAGRHTAWAYCHVPNGSRADMAEAIEAQVERFAPGFRSRVLARHVMPPEALERANPNLVGGDVGGGALSLRQILFRPTRLRYRTPLRGVWICSSSTPPGGGVHGMCGYHAAMRAM
jgi:phytoene dehydrogenase-like protein